MKRRSSRRKVTRKPTRKYARKAPARKRKTLAKTLATSRPRPEVYTFKRHFPTRYLGYNMSTYLPDGAVEETSEYLPQNYIRDPVTNDIEDQNDQEGSGTIINVMPPPVAGIGPYAVRGKSFFLKSMWGRMVVGYGGVQSLPFDFPYRVVAGWFKPSRLMAIWNQDRSNFPVMTGEPKVTELLGWWIQMGRGIRVADGIETDSWYKGPDLRATESAKSHLIRHTGQAGQGGTETGRQQAIAKITEKNIDMGRARMYNGISSYKSIVEIVYDKKVHKRGRRYTSAQSHQNSIGPSDVADTAGQETPADPTKPDQLRVYTQNTVSSSNAQTVRTPDVHRWNWGRNRYCKVVTSSNIGAMTWDGPELIDSDGDIVNSETKNISITDAPNNWDPEQPVPFCFTFFPNQKFLDQRDELISGNFNREAPRGPDYLKDGVSTSPPAWQWWQPHNLRPDGSGVANAGMACFQPTVDLEVGMSYMDN